MIRNNLAIAFDQAFANKIFEAVRAGQGDAIAAELTAPGTGIVFDRSLGRPIILNRPAGDIRLFEAADGKLACDAQPELVLNNNAGIPSFFTNALDPQQIHILTSPNKAAQIMGGEQQYGDWTTQTYIVTTIQHTGEVSAYGDYNTNGMASAVMNFPQRQAFSYQIFTQWGEKELAVAAAARVNLAAEKTTAALTQMANYQNLTYFYGVSGLANYGLLNDPALTPALVSSARWSTLGAIAIYNEIRRLFIQIQLQSNGVIDAQASVVLAMSPTLAIQLTTTNEFGLTVSAILKQSFPNIRFETAVQYGNQTGGELVQMIVESVNGVRTVQPAFTEKMRAHAVVVGASSWSQKRSAGTFGTILKNPYAVAQMIGC